MLLAVFLPLDADGAALQKHLLTAYPNSIETIQRTLNFRSRLLDNLRETGLDLTNSLRPRCSNPVETGYLQGEIVNGQITNKMILSHDPEVYDRMPRKTGIC